MEHILNLASVEKKMKDKPKGQRLYHFFWGTSSVLTYEQIKEIKKIATAEHRKMDRYLNAALQRKKKKDAGKPAVVRN